MAVFRSPAKQAASVMRELQGTILKSVRTVENYERGLTRVTEWTQREKLSDGLRGLTREQAIAYLEQRGQAVGQKCLDMERQAIQAMFRHVTNKLGAGETLPVIKAIAQASPEERAFWDRTIARGRQEDGDLEQALAIMARHGAMEAARADALAWADRARAAIAQLPDPPIRGMLSDLAAYVVARIN